MRIILSGHNLDIAVIAEAREKGVAESRLTPEPLSEKVEFAPRVTAPL